MSNYFLNPTALWWAAAASIIVLFYLLRLRRRPVTVPSVLLWRRVVKDFAANTPFQRLKKNLLLLLQLLVFLLLVTALARPYFESQLNIGQRTAIVVDTSYSMLAEDGGSTRLQRAKSEARRLIDSLKEGQEMMLLAASDRVELLSGFTGERGQLLDALNRLDTTVGASPRLDSALELVDSLAEQVPSSVVLITDGGVPDVEREFGNLTEVRQVSVGSTEAQNIGITNAAVNYDPVQDSFTALARVENFTGAEREVTVELVQNDQLIEAQARTLPAGEASEVVFTGLPYLEEGVSLRLADTDDALAEDNSVELAMREPSPPDVLLVSDNSLLQAALRANRRISVTQTAPGSGPPQLSQYDAVITDSELGEQWPGTNYFFIGGASHPLLPGNRGEELGGQTVVEQQDTHPLLRFVDFSRIQIGRSYEFTPDDGAETVVEGSSGPLLVANQTGGHRVVYLGFAVQNSNFPLQSTYPVFLSNVVDWISGGRTEQSLNLAVGEVYQQLVDASVTGVQVETPSGQAEQAQVREGSLSFSQTHELGRYNFVNPPAGASGFTVNLLNRRESDLSQSASVEIAGEAVTEERSVMGNREIFRWLIILGLVVVVGEWWLFHRRSFG